MKHTDECAYEAQRFAARVAAFLGQLPQEATTVRGSSIFIDTLYAEAVDRAGGFSPELSRQMNAVANGDGWL